MSMAIPRATAGDAISSGRISLMGLPVDVVNQTQAVERILQGVRERRGGWVITPNLDQLRQFAANPEVRLFYQEASLILADGMPLVWASRLQGTPLPERVAGSSLVPALTAAAAEQGASVYFLGGNPRAAFEAARRLRELHPSLNVAGTYCPPMGFEHNPEELEAIVRRLREARPDIVLVGLGFPKQERLIRQLRGVLPKAWFLGVGISFSFVSGEVRRAPSWVQQAGLEWLHRLVQEPRRLAGRYLVHDLPFAARLFAAALRARWRSGGPQGSTG